MMLKDDIFVCLCLTIQTFPFQTRGFIVIFSDYLCCYCGTSPLPVPVCILLDAAGGPADLPEAGGGV